MITGLLM